MRREELIEESRRVGRAGPHPGMASTPFPSKPVREIRPRDGSAWPGQTVGDGDAARPTDRSRACVARSAM